jgi:hypothetical protein
MRKDEKRNRERAGFFLRMPGGRAFFSFKWDNHMSANYYICTS